MCVKLARMALREIFRTRTIEVRGWIAERFGRSKVARLGRRQYRFPGGHDDGPMLGHVRSEKFGVVPAPESLSEFAQLLEYIFESGEGILGWRGQSDISWDLDSSAVRRQKEHTAAFDAPGADRESQTLDYEQRLLDEARASGHGFRDGKRLSDLELLSVLQHHGAATRFLDFTRNAFIALWFATGSNLKGDGLVVAIREEPGSYELLRAEDQVNRPLEETLHNLRFDASAALRPKERFALWEPHYLFDRMRVQQSLFVFGRVLNTAWGSAPFGLSDPGSEKPPSNLLFIAVPEALKRKLAEEAGFSASWESIFGYSNRYLFPELDGYARANSADSNFHRSFFARHSQGEVVGRIRRENLDK